MVHLVVYLRVTSLRVAAQWLLAVLLYWTDSLSWLAVFRKVQPNCLPFVQPIALTVVLLLHVVYNGYLLVPPFMKVVLSRFSFSTTWKWVMALYRSLPSTAWNHAQPTGLYLSVVRLEFRVRRLFLVVRFLPFATSTLNTPLQKFHFARMAWYLFRLWHLVVGWTLPPTVILKPRTKPTQHCYKQFALIRSVSMWAVKVRILFLVLHQPWMVL